jgi:hypothetical protein
MKFTAALIITNVAGASAFAPPRRHSSIKQQRSQQQSPTAVHLVGDSSILQADIVEGLVSTVGSLALLGSVGFGVFAGYKDDEWDYEYKPGNDEASKKYGAGADLALIEVSPEEVAEDIVKVCLNFTSSHNRCILILCSYGEWPPMLITFSFCIRFISPPHHPYFRTFFTKYISCISLSQSFIGRRNCSSTR